MHVFLNGKFVPEEQAVVSVFDRSFLYGDGLFETMRVANGIPFRWDQHLERLECGAEFLEIKLPFNRAELRGFADHLIGLNGSSPALLRLTLSRGVGVRGYSPRGAHSPVVVMTLHPAPSLDEAPSQRWTLKTSSFKLPADEPLAQFKNCNKLPQILARAEAEHAGANEALLLNTDGYVVEGASSNLFWIAGQTIVTAPLASGILSGITRLVVLELCRNLGLAAEERRITGSDLAKADGVFLSLSSAGIVAAESLDGTRLRQSPLTARLQERYLELVRSETVTTKNPQSTEEG
jgi:branched-chain amino acid aminotransferase